VCPPNRGERSTRMTAGVRADCDKTKYDVLRCRTMFCSCCCCRLYYFV